MISPGIKKKLLKDLDKLPIDMQKKVQDFAHTLLVSQPKGVPGKDLLKFSGILESNISENIMSEIETGCGVVDDRDW
jgi:hypothetical protein